MIRPSRLLLGCVLLLLGRECPPADAATTLIPTTPLFTTDTSGNWHSDWQGEAGYTYFVQWSLNLLEWQYFADLRFGSGALDFDGSSSTTEFFIRLHYTDAPTNDPATADFDNDGIGNQEELDFTQMHRDDPDPRHKTYASYWLREISLLKNFHHECHE
jgi:hypothetical protein